MDRDSTKLQFRFHSRDLRKGRVSRTGQIYLITTATWKRRRIFVNYQAARRVVDFLMKRSRTLAYEITSLMQLAGQECLSSIMRSLKGYSARQIRICTGVYGRIWQTGFHDHAVRWEEDLKSLARYVVGNPIRAGLAETVGDYPHWDAVWF